MGGTFWVIVSEQYTHIATIYKNLICVQSQQGEQFKVSPHYSKHTSVQCSQTEPSQLVFDSWNGMICL